MKKSEVVIYTMTGEKVTVMKVHSEDDINDPYYTIQMADEREKQTVRNKLQTEVAWPLSSPSYVSFSTAGALCIYHDDSVGRVSCVSHDGLDPVLCVRT